MTASSFLSAGYDTELQTTLLLAAMLHYETQKNHQIPMMDMNCISILERKQQKYNQNMHKNDQQINNWRFPGGFLMHRLISVRGCVRSYNAFAQVRTSHNKNKLLHFHIAGI